MLNKFKCEKEIEEIIDLINNIWSKIDNMLHTQHKIVIEGTKIINIAHEVPRTIVEGVILDAEKHRNKDNDLQSKKSESFYLDFFPRVEITNFFSNVIKSDLKANCNARHVLDPHRTSYGGFLPKTGILKQIYKDKNMDLTKSLIEHHLGYIFKQEYSLSILMNKFIKEIIKKSKSIPLNDDIVNLIIDYLPGNHFLKRFDIDCNFYNEIIYEKVCKMIDSLYDDNDLGTDNTISFNSHINNSLFLDNSVITNILKNKN